MEFLLSQLTRRAKGGIATREESVSAEVIRIGRGAENEMHLPDPRVPLRLATLHMRQDGLYIEAVGTPDLRLNGAVARNARLRIGDRVGLGPYEMVVAEPPAGKDAAVTLEMVQPMGDDLEALLARSKTELTSFLGLGKRAWSWLLFVVIAVGFIGLPIASSQFQGGTRAMLHEAYGKLGLEPPSAVDGRVAADIPGHAPARLTRAGMQPVSMGFDIAWKSGEMLNSHKFFGDDCGACHQKPFVMVENGACIACHIDQTQHADPVEFPSDELAVPRCAACHKEHQGDAPLLIARQGLCSGCHQNLTQEHPKTDLIDAADFGTNHPQFRPLVWVDPATAKRQRISLDDGPKEVSNLEFSHKLHLDKTKMRRPDIRPGERYVQLDCEDCHRTEPGGGLMAPMVMEDQCGECHLLNFDAKRPARWVSHGEPEIVYRELREYYAAQALEGGVPDPEAPPVVRRLRPGAPITETERLQAFEWANRQADKAMDYVFSISKCGGCHVVETTGDRSDWTVKPVAVARQWQPKSVFSHVAHTDVDCGVCHAAETSEVSSDVLLPGIETCRQCHGGETARDKVPSTCITCHIFHQPGLAPMVGKDAAAAAVPDYHREVATR